MVWFEALRIDPYARTAAVVRLAAPRGAAASPVTLAAAFGGDAPAYAFSAEANQVPAGHWTLMAPLVHAGRPDRFSLSPETLGVSVRQVYAHTEFRGMLWTRDDMPISGTPERDAIPGFSFLDSSQPGLFWNGCACLVLYRRESTQTYSNRAFLDVTARVAVSWTRVLGVQQLSRLRFTWTEGSVGSLALPSCAACARYLEGQRSRCVACQRVYYCDAVCQRAHWRQHKALCRAATAS